MAQAIEMRFGALPVLDDVNFVVEQNRDGQVYDLIRLELPPDQVGRLRSIRYYDGQPIPAEAITRPLMELEAVPA
jgi:2-oxoglutarate ferredoxin oxidoreductase subunit alpha